MPCNPHKHCLQAFLVFCVSVHTANTPHHAPSSVIPAQAGIHVLRVGGMDSRRRGNDDRAWLSKCSKRSGVAAKAAADKVVLVAGLLYSSFAACYGVDNICLLLGIDR